MKKIHYPALVLAAGLALMGIAVAQHPESDIDPRRHPNLAEAQHHIAQAYESVKAAEKVHPAEFGGHLGEAIKALDQASHEIKEGAEFYNHHHK
jgi:hypothetical protein